MKKMKRFKKLVSVMMTMAMVLAMALPVMAAPANKTITIKPSPTVPITENSQFTAYKILDAVDVGTEGQIAYTVPEGMKSFYNTRYNLNGSEPDYAAQVAKKISEEPDMYVFGNAAKSAAVSANIAGKTGSKSGENYVISGLDVGYYVVVDSETGETASQVILDTTVDNVEVVVKADVPTIDKTIVGSAGSDDKDGDPTTSGNVSSNNEAVGDDVPYQLKTKVPAMSNFVHYRYVISDNLSKGLTYNNDIEIKIGTYTLSGADYTVTSTNRADGGTNIRIVFTNFIKWRDAATSPTGDSCVGQDIIITYSAKLNEDAVIGTAGNPNTAKLLYSNDRSEEAEGRPDDFGPDDVQGETEDTTVRTYVTGLQLNKVNASGNELRGAQFTLSGNRLNKVNEKGARFEKDSSGDYWKLTDDTYTKQAPNDKTQHLYASKDIKYKKVDVDNWVTTTDHITATVSVNDDGTLVFTGLAAGEYEIKEIKAPNGYNLLKETIYVTIECNNGKDSCTWTGTYKIGTSGTVTNLNFASDTGIIDGLNVVNNTGTELPSTGGIGTTIFYIIGGILVVGAAILLVTKKRMSKEA